MFQIRGLFKVQDENVFSKGFEECLPGFTPIFSYSPFLSPAYFFPDNLSLCFLTVGPTTGINASDIQTFNLTMPMEQLLHVLGLSAQRQATDLKLLS